MDISVLADQRAYKYFLSLREGPERTYGQSYYKFLADKIPEPSDELCEDSTPEELQRIRTYLKLISRTSAHRK